MAFLRASGLVGVGALLLMNACSSDSGEPQAAAGAGGSGSPGAGAGNVAGSGNTAGTGTAAGAGGTGNGSAGAAGQQASGGTGNGTAGAAGQQASGGSGTAGSGTAGTGNEDPKPARPIAVMPGNNYNGNYNGQQLSLNKSQPAQGKLVLLLGGICSGTGAGGFEAFVKKYGFHVFAPKTDTCVNSAPQKYKDIIKTMPNDKEANRQVGDARMELWDGVDRVDWVTVAKGQSIVEQTVGALNFAKQADPGGDWGWFLNDDGTLRTTDVWVVGYSWGSQAWAMISAYVRFGRVIATSGPVAEGFPNGEWMTHPGPNATPGDRKYMLVDLPSPYPVPGNGNMEKFDNVMKAGWTGAVTSVTPTSPGPYTAAQHLFAMIGDAPNTPGGHTVFCNDNASNGWIPLCKHVMGIAP